MVNYKETVEKIKSQLKKGDIEAIVNKAGYSRQVFMTATKKEDWSDLTNGRAGSYWCSYRIPYLPKGGKTKGRTAMIPLTASETEAVLYLAEYEIVKIAADKRCVSEHTEKNQIKSAMGQIGCNPLKLD